MKENKTAVYLSSLEVQKILAWAEAKGDSRLMEIMDEALADIQAKEAQDAKRVFWADSAKRAAAECRRIG